MGFPVGYTELFFPKLLIHTLSFLGFIRKFISWLFKFMGLGDFLESDITWSSSSSENYHSHSHSHHQCQTEFHSVSAVLIREMIPVIKFGDLVNEAEQDGADGEKIDVPESCAVCLYDFENSEEIRRLTNCRHIFHRSCLDRWMDHDQKTCPLCRTPFIPDDLQEAFNERLWAASGVPDFYGEFSSSTSSVF
ncbi:hypothetical protein C5167_048195 [Papaver somniferum]|uniref:RING-type domain-containing protein n=1 Tax=Papaver somniferum TaxID=3469 RepID=A0A4Y7KKL0_PAPSO|nr:E3 ubiquitin-protein ligase RHA1B-like [Papaver somniferum]RZC72721.1 hypothetical protein C5167_048195 [Papaver somniferum]